MTPTPDFSGWATKNDLKCADGLTIRSGAFDHNDGQKVPLVWQHGHNDVESILGHAILEKRPDGVYAHGYFNDTPKAKHIKESVMHGDIDALSIYANQLIKKNKNVLHGQIRELSLTLSGANPGARIENVNIAHGEDGWEYDDEGIITTGDTIAHAENTEEEKGMAEATTETEAKDDERTVKDVFDAFTEEQKNVVYYMIGEALESQEEDAEDDEDTNDTAAQSAIDSYKEGFNMARNVFENNGSAVTEENVLNHSQIEALLADARDSSSLKNTVLAHATEYGIENIDYLFPDAKAISNTPDFIGRRTEWVASVINGAKHSPFSRIRSIHADITADEARAKGYIKGKMKKEEVIKLLRRKTDPTTIFKKQKIDRDDVLDITDLDVIAYLKAEMRYMLEEEMARAILIGDGRAEDDDDKIDEEKLRPIAKDDDLYAPKVRIASNLSVESTIEALIRARSNYRGTGTPTLYTTLPFLTDMLLSKDKMGRRIYDGVDALASALMVTKIEAVDVMEGDAEVEAVFVNMVDYTIGADKGGNVTMFEDFDIDFNQHKQLIETRISGALTKPYSAIVVLRDSGTSVTPDAPSFDGATNTITIPTKTGVIYTVNDELETGSVVITEDATVSAQADDGFYIPSGTTTSWTFVYTSGE